MQEQIKLEKEEEAQCMGIKVTKKVGWGVSRGSAPSRADQFLPDRHPDPVR